MHRKILQVTSIAMLACGVIWGLAGCEIYGPLGAGSFNTVVVDAGHGGHARGARPYRGLYEKDVALDTAVRLAKELKRRGFRVIMTRDRDKFVSLDERVSVSNRTGGSIFVSVHYNWAPGPSAHGVETFYYSDRSRRLAWNVQKELAGCYSTPNRGVKQRGFYVLRKNRRPAILVECGFLSSPSDNKLAQSASGRQKIAKAIADGILAERRGRGPR